jgi:hypothetical protein
MCDITDVAVRALAADQIATSFGSVAGEVASLMAERGSATLQAIVTGLPASVARAATADGDASGAREANLCRAQLRTLLHHQLCRHDPYTGHYSIDTFRAVVRMAMPAIATTLTDHYGAIVDLLVPLLLEHHNLPLATLAGALHSIPNAQATLDRMVTDGILVPCGGAAVESETVSSYGFSPHALLFLYRPLAALKFLADGSTGCTPAQLRVLQVVIGRCTTPTEWRTLAAAAIEAAPMVSAAVALPAIRAALPNMSDGDFSAAVHGLMTPAGIPGDANPLHPLLQQSGDSGDAAVKLSYACLAERAQRALLNASIRARFGQPGMRILRALLEHSALEEASLGQELLLELTQLRALLQKMQCAGIITLHELLKPTAGDLFGTNAPAERVFKHSIFVWRVRVPSALLGCARAVCQSLRTTRRRLRSEAAVASRVVPSSVLQHSSSEAGPEAPRPLYTEDAASHTLDEETLSHALKLCSAPPLMETGRPSIPNGPLRRVMGREHSGAWLRWVAARDLLERSGTALLDALLILTASHH